MFKETASHTILKKLFNSFIREKIFSDKKLTAKTKKRFSFSRIEMTDFPILEEFIDGMNIHTKIDNPIQLLTLMKKEDPTSFENFSSELENSIENLALALEAYEIGRKEFAHAYPKIRSSIDLVREKIKCDPSFSPLSFYEQCSIQGHPLHPGAKTRMGLSKEDVIAYSPEWRHVVSLNLVAVRRGYSKVTSLGDENLSIYLFNHFPEIKEKIKSELNENNLKLNEFEIFPIHPWQYQNTLLKMYTEQIEKKIIFPIKKTTINAKPLISFRSFCSFNENANMKNHFHIKTSLNILTTGDVRTISERATESGPLISKIIADIIEKNRKNGFSFFHVLKEFLGAHYKDKENNSELNKFFSENLSIILRENPEKYLSECEICLPAASLIEKSPVNNKLILNEFIEEYYKNNHFDSLQTCAKDFFKKYILLSIEPFLTLMCRYGISLEGHLQNSVVSFSKGTPSRIFIRDFADIRISKKRLENQNYEINLSLKNSHIFCQDDSGFYKNMFHAVYQNHYGEIIIALSTCFSISEIDLWEIVFTLTKQTFSKMKKDPRLAPQIEEDEKSLFQPYIQSKAMTKMRLHGEISNYYFVDVENPLHYFHRRNQNTFVAQNEKKYDYLQETRFCL